MPIKWMDKARATIARLKVEKELSLAYEELRMLPPIVPRETVMEVQARIRALETELGPIISDYLRFTAIPRAVTGLWVRPDATTR